MPSKNTTTYKDMEKFRVARNRSRKKNYANGNFGYENPKRWTTEEIALAMEHSITDRELAKMLGRSIQSIQTKRSKIKRKQQENEHRSNVF